MAIIPVLTKNGTQAKTVQPTATSSSRVVPVMTRATPLSKPKPSTPVKTAPAKPVIKQPDLPSAKSIFQIIQSVATNAAKSKIKETEADVASVGRTLQKVPNVDYGTKNQKKFQATDTETKIVDFISNFPSAIAQSYGRSLEMVATPDGRGKIKQGAKDLPKTMSDVKTHIDNREWGKALQVVLENPAISVALDVSDFIPASALFTKGGKILVKKLVKEGVEEAGEKVVKETAEQVGKKTSIELTPQEARNKVFQDKIENTKQGTKIVMDSFDAQAQVKNLLISDKSVKIVDVGQAATPSTRVEGGVKLSGASTTEPSLRSSANVASDVVASREVPSSLTTRKLGVSKSTQKSLSSNRTNFLKSFDMTNPSKEDYTKYYDDMKAAKPEFDSTLDSIAKELDGTTTSRLKSQESLSKKLARKTGRPLGDMNDTIAGTIIVDDVDKAVDLSKNKGVNITTDYRQKPTFLGYKGVHGDIELPNGAVGEVQFNTKQGLLQKKEAHKIYDKWREYIEYNDKATLNGVYDRIPSNRRPEFIADVQRSNDIYNEKIKVTEVKSPRQQLPVKSEGAEKASRLEARVTKSLDKTPQEIKDQLGSTYTQMNKKENIQKASQYVTKNPDEAMAVLRGEKEAPQGILKNSIYVAMENMAVGDTALARKLASLQSTRAGQELSILTEINPDSPVKHIRDIIKVREEVFRKKHGGKSVQEVSKKVVEDIKSKVKKPDKYDWNNFVKSLPTC